MDNELKFYLLAEKSGWNCSTYAFEYRKKITSISSYQILSYNVIEAKKQKNNLALDLVDEFNNLKLEPKTIEEAFILETKINYMCLHSYPEFYLNPFAIDPNYNGEITSIGMLIFPLQGQNMTLNELMEDKKVTQEMKQEAIKDRIDTYLGDMTALIKTSISNIQNKSSERKERRSLSIFEICLFIILNFFMFFVLVYPQDKYWECFYNPRGNYALTYVSYILPISIYLYDFFFILYHTFNAIIEEPYNYSKRFLKYHPEKLYDDILHQSEKLYDYINGALTNHLKLINDIHMFSKLSGSYIDYSKILEIPNQKNKMRFRIIKAINYITSTLVGIIAFFCFLLYLYNTILNVAF